MNSAICFVAAFALLKGYLPHHRHFDGCNQNLSILATAAWPRSRCRCYAHLPG